MKNYCIDCGTEIESRSKRCKRCANIGKRNPNYGKVTSETQKKLVSEKVSRKIKSKWRKPEYRNKMINALHKSHRTKKFRKHCSDLAKKQHEEKRFGKILSSNTCLEIKIKKELKNKGIKFIPQKYIRDIGYVDFYLEVKNRKIVIECDGEYWHKRPETRKIDYYKNRKLKNLGFEIFRFWGKEIIKSPSNCISQILEVG